MTAHIMLQNIISKSEQSFDVIDTKTIISYKNIDILMTLYGLFGMKTA